MSVRLQIAGSFVLIAAGLLTTACSGSNAAPARPIEVRLASSWLEPLAEELKAEYERLIPNVNVSVVERTPSLSAVEKGLADVTITSAAGAYFAYRGAAGEARPRGGLRAIAALGVVPLQMIVRGGLPIRDLAGLRGHSIASDRNRPSGLINLVLQEAGLTREITSLRAISDDELNLLATGELDAFMVVTPYPAARIESAIEEGARLLPIEGPAVERLLRANPVIRLTKIPAGTYPRQTTAIHTIGTDIVYVCRADLDEALVFELTRALFQALPNVSKRVPPLRLVNVERASNVPIPLHEGAARYYRELELQ